VIPMPRSSLTRLLNRSPAQVSTSKTLSEVTRNEAR
jgi:hypothetical protein